MYYCRTESFVFDVPAVKLRNYYDGTELSTDAARKILLGYYGSVSISAHQFSWHLGFRNQTLDSVCANRNNSKTLTVKISAECFYFKPEVGEALDFVVSGIDPKYITGHIMGLKVLMQLQDLINTRKYEYHGAKEQLVEKAPLGEAKTIAVGSRLRSLISAIKIEPLAYKSYIKVSGRIPVPLVL